ncbi:MAG: pyridoxine 5'-phosphate synthase [Candidatus Zixiibacteriota bacterium]
MPTLGIKLDSVTWMREGKRERDPDPAQAAVLAEQGGADAIVAHLGSSRRHVRDRDIYILKEIVKTRLAVEIPADNQLLSIALEVNPAQVTIVSENRVDPTGAETLDYSANFEKISEVSERLRSAGISVSHFIQPNGEDTKNAARCKADYVQLSTVGYSSAGTAKEAEAELDDIERISQLAHKFNMGVTCGGGITYANVTQCAELNLVQHIIVGRAVIKRALMLGMERAVKLMRDELTRKL